MFPTAFSKNNSEIKTSSGSRFAPTYCFKVQSDGRKELTPTGRVDTYELIQSWRSSCDLKVILDRFAAGDTSVLQQRQPMFGDFTTMPRTLPEFQQIMIDARADFDRLPIEVRREFNFNADEYIASFGTDRFFEVFKNANGADRADRTESVKEESANAE